MDQGKGDHLSSIRRISNTLQHFNSDSNSNTTSQSSNEYPLTAPNYQFLMGLLEGEYGDDRDKLRNLMQSNDSFNELHLFESINQVEHRERTLQACKEIIKANVVRVPDMRDRPAKFLSWFETISLCDPSVALKFAVQYNLWGGTILFLGTEKHHKQYLEGISSGEKLGVFGLTELGHGTNVQGLETTATFDEKTNEFIINSPTWTSQKFWPGNIATHGQFATIFAKLILRGENKGVHAFVVPIRSPPSPSHKYGQLLPGVKVRDIGLKTSFNGIDNGGLWFENVRIPNANMLDKFSRVDEKGVYHSKLPSNVHFASMMSVFFIGRLCISAMCLASMKGGLAIALSYAHHRKQFGPPGMGDQPIINHSTTQRRLIPSLARVYALDSFHKYIVNNPNLPADVQHSYSSGLKAFTSWEALEALQQGRETMGGQGLRLPARIALLRDHIDLGTTGEGDNVVLCQQVAKFLVQKYNSSLKNGGVFQGELAYINNIAVKPTITNWRSMLYQQWLLEQREFQMIRELHKKMYGNNKDIKPNTKEWFALWNGCLTLCIKLTKANVDRLVHFHFLQNIVHITKTADASSLTFLKRLCCLDGLVQINRDLGFFTSTGLITGENKWISLDDEINQLCKELTPFSLGLIDTFGIPKKFHPYIDSIEP